MPSAGALQASWSRSPDQRRALAAALAATPAAACRHRRHRRLLLTAVGLPELVAAMNRLARWSIMGRKDYNEALITVNGARGRLERRGGYRGACAARAASTGSSAGDRAQPGLPRVRHYSVTIPRAPRATAATGGQAVWSAAGLHRTCARAAGASAAAGLRGASWSLLFTRPAACASDAPPPPLLFCSVVLCAASGSAPPLPAAPLNNVSVAPPGPPPAAPTSTTGGSGFAAP